MLVFTSDEVGVGVAISSKIKPTESVGRRTPISLMNPSRLRSCENYIVGVRSRSGRTNQSHSSIPGLVIGWFLIISHGVVNGIGSNGNVPFLPTPILSSL